MTWLRRLFQQSKTFHNQQQFVIMLACSIVLFVSLGSSLIYESVSFNHGSRARLAALADIIAADISAALVFNDTRAINKTLQSLEADSTITQLLVLNAQGAVAGSYIRRDRPQMPLDVAQSLKRMRQEASQPFFELSPKVSRPIIHDGEQLGSILVELDRNVFINKLLVSGGIGTGILFLSILCSYLLARRLGQIVTAPIQSLAATMEEVTLTKNYHARADVRGVIELAQLAEGFNNMLGEIAQRDAALLESEFRWKFAIEGSGDGVWDWNPQTDEAKYSRRWKEMLGYAEDEILPANQEWVDRIHPDDQSYVAGAMQAYLAGKTAIYVVEYRLKCKDGSYKWILGRGMVVSRSEDGKPLRMIGTHTDITQRKQAEEQILMLNVELESRVKERTAELERINKELEGFCYAISHEFRAPIARLEGFGSMLLELVGLDGEEATTHCAQRIVTAGNQLRNVIDALLTMNRLSRADMLLSPVDLSEMSQQIVAELLEQFDTRVISIHIAPDVVVRGDRFMLEVCMRNLLGNALKYTSKTEGASIEFGNFSRDGININFVRDNGVGFAMEYAQKLFVPFCRLHTKEEFEGTGIGLATVHRIIEKHHGRIWAEAEPGKGATFYFTIGVPGDWLTGSLTGL